MTAPIHHRRNRLVSHPKLRRQLFQKEHGVCQQCGRDCEALRKHLRSLSPEARRLERLRLGIPEGQSWTWEIDHETPVAEGGPVSTWGNFPMEGIVLRPATELRTRGGHRIIAKLKHRDFA